MTSSIFSRPPPQEHGPHSGRIEANFANLSRIVSISPRSAKRPGQSPFACPARPGERTGHAATGETALFAFANPPQRQGFQPHERDGRLSVPAPRGRRPPPVIRVWNSRRGWCHRRISLPRREHTRNAVKARVPPESPDRFGHRPAARSSATGGETCWLWRIGG
jgi:hypothetical protein